jgi:hypothetical protein
MIDLEQLAEAVDRMSGLVDSHQRILVSSEGSMLLSRKTADALYSPAVMRQKLSSGGEAPLALDGLKGPTAHTQASNLPALAALPQLGDPAYKPGDAVVVGKTLYHRAATSWEPLTSPASTSPAVAAIAAVAAQQTILGGSGSGGGAGGGGGVVGPATTYDTSSSLAGKPTAPNANDRYYNSYFGRWWTYTGSAWVYDNSIEAGAQVCTSGGAPEGPATAWQACDGSVVNCALAGCTIGTKTASHFEAVAGNNPAIEGGAGSTGAAQSAAAATLATNAAVGVGTLGTGSDSGAGITFLAAGVGSTAAESPHTHSITGTPAVTQQPVLNVPNEANGGLGLRISANWFMRR